MSRNQQTIINGVTVTWGYADDHRFRDMTFVTIGDSRNHTTYILDPRRYPADQVIAVLHAKGTDRYFWQSLAVAVLGAGQFSG